MTNEEKAREIAKTYDKSEYSVSFMSAIVTAEWKDAQFKEYLEKKRTECIAAYDRSLDYAACINEIIDELFSKIENDNSENDE